MSGTQYASSIEISPSLSVKHTIAVAKSPVVRRLTPIECERLQGFPDNWTQVQHKGKPMADGPRYKMCGNSIAVPVIEWIFKRIQEVR
jgi:DNA (cytosine-5)-methyltransferase 1